MVGLRLEWSIHVMSFNVLLTCARLSFWASFCRGIVTHISFGWFQDLGEELGRSDVVKLRIWLALGFGVPALFGEDALCSRMPKGAKVELICIIHKKRGKTHSSPNRSRLGWKLNPQTQTLNPAKGFGCRECLKIKGSQSLDLLKIQFSYLNDAFPGNFCIHETPRSFRKSMIAMPEVFRPGEWRACVGWAGVAWFVGVAAAPPW